MVSLVTIQRYYTVIDFVSHTVHSIPVTYLFCNWTFVPLYFPHLFHSSPYPSLLWHLPVCSLYLTITDLLSVSMTLFLFCYIFLIWFLYSTCK